MKEIKRLTIKYFCVVIALFIAQLLLNAFFPKLYQSIIITEAYTQTQNTLWSFYDDLFFNSVLAFFIYSDLRRLGVKNIAIPLLTVLSSVLGLFLSACLLINHKLKNEFS